MDASPEKTPREVESSKNINLFNLDKNIAHLISGYLADKDLINLCTTSKELHRIFRPSLARRLVSYFLKFVVEGRLDKVEETLNRNKKLVLLHGNITDLSGRVFTRITAFQYAIWALDKEMWELILKYLPEAEAYDQLMVFENERPDITEVYGKRFSFQSLLNTYQKYIDNFDRWDRDQREACWCKEVGGVQRQMPAWFVYIFFEGGAEIPAVACEPARTGNLSEEYRKLFFENFHSDAGFGDFSPGGSKEGEVWPTKDVKKSFTRDSTHLRWWFDKEYNKGKLGFKWAAVRVEASSCARIEWAQLDRQHFNSWAAEKTSCRDSLSDYLKRIVEIKNSTIQLNNF